MNINAVKDAMPAEEESHHDHGHDFASVVEFLFMN